MHQQFNLLKPKTYIMYHQLEHSEILCSAHNAFICFVWISEQRAIISLYSINLAVFKTEAESVYCAVRNGSSNQTDNSFVLKGLTFNNRTLCPHYIYMLCIYLRTNSELRHLYHKMLGFYNRDEKCLLRGTNWVFK